jgi:hypothetical protein
MSNRLRYTLAGLNPFLGLNAVSGAVWVVPGLPHEWLTGTPFPDYVVPALALGLMGLGACVAGVMLVVRPRWGTVLSGLVGAGVMIFELVETSVVGWDLWAHALGLGPIRKGLPAVDATGISAPLGIPCHSGSSRSTSSWVPSSSRSQLSGGVVSLQDCAAPPGWPCAGPYTARESERSSHMPSPTATLPTTVAPASPSPASALATSPRADGRVAPADRAPGAPAWPMVTSTTNATARLGFWSGMLATSLSVIFSIVSVPVLLGLVAPPWGNVLTLLPSLLLAPALLVLLVCVHDATPVTKQIWSHLAVAFAGVYVTLVSVVYVVDLAVVEPLVVRGQADRAGLLTIDPGGILNAIDGLGYIFLCLALLFIAPLFPGRGLNRWIRWLLVVNGAVMVPIALTYFVDRAFLMIAGPLWALAIPAVSVLLATVFRRAG